MDSGNGATVAPCDCPNLRANGETETRRGLMRDAARVADVLGLDLTPAAIRVLVDRYVDAGTRDTFAVWFLGYADPTGNAAVRHVMTGAPQ